MPRIPICQDCDTLWPTEKLDGDTKTEEDAKIELTGALQQALESGREPCEAVDPRTQTRYVVVRADVFEHLKALAYDDSPWTDEEKSLLAAESGQAIGWDEMNEYDDYDRKKP